jgi:hypothetical protein
MQEALLFIQSEKYKQDYCYISWLTRCYIMNGNPRQAWELYLKVRGLGYGQPSDDQSPSSCHPKRQLRH